jgi:hypothetical protein
MDLSSSLRRHRVAARAIVMQRKTVCYLDV